MSNVPSLMSLAWSASETTRKLSGPTATGALPAAALIREISLAGSHVVMSFSRRTISAVAASKSERTCAGSRSGVVNAANARWVPIACPSAVTFWAGAPGASGLPIVADGAGASRGASNVSLATGRGATVGSGEAGDGARSLHDAIEANPTARAKTRRERAIDGARLHHRRARCRFGRGEDGHVDPEAVGMPGDRLDELAALRDLRETLEASVPELERDAGPVDDHSKHLRPAPATRARDAEREQVAGLDPLFAQEDAAHVRPKDRAERADDDHGRQHARRDGTAAVPLDHPPEDDGRRRSEGVRVEHHPPENEGTQHVDGRRDPRPEGGAELLLFARRGRVRHLETRDQI